MESGAMHFTLPCKVSVGNSPYMVRAPSRAIAGNGFVAGNGRILTGFLIALAAVGVAVPVAAQVATEPERFLVGERELVIETEGGRGIVTESHLLKFDTATGQIWRYERRNWSDPEKQGAWWVAIPLEGNAATDKEPGRFRLVTRTGGKMTQPFPDVLIVDGTTGAVWVYRGIRQARNGVWVLNERFMLVKDADAQK